MVCEEGERVVAGLAVHGLEGAMEGNTAWCFGGWCG